MPRILVVAPNWIGDALMAQPLLARLREKLPDLRIDVLAPAWVAPVLRRMPEVGEVIETAFRHGALELRARWRLGRGLRARHYDQALVLPNSWKSALPPFFADIPLRSGYVGESRFGLLNLVYRSKDPGASMALHYAQLSEKPGKAPREPLPQTGLNVDAAIAEATAQRFGLAGRYAVLCPGAEYGPAKRWPGFAELAGRLRLPVVLLGSVKDRATCAGIGGRNLAGETTLEEAIELIACADFVVSNDSGLMHVAAAVGTPQVALFGSSSPVHTPPLSERARVVWLGLDCSPCYARECPLGHLRCLREIPVERVLEEIGRLGNSGAE
ncbi:MAG: lipopolysaccharide heptosyltransferase II [Betaproteobacteria bacterium RIFCSPLOWO2_02_FULL_68_150]|nr:MAG: lipopolysaccharide heptosyltransferase II [Betaproteobacteria bacterium RIFCSPLOWO2_02_FULL_68_150]